MGLGDLTPEQFDLAKRVEANRPENKQLRVMSDIAAMCEELIRLGDTKTENSDKFARELGAVLVDMRQSLEGISKKETPESPDYAKPVVERLKQLETALTGALKKIKPTVNLPAPNVTVEPAEVDLSGVEKVLKEMPKAFKEAIKLVPKTEIPEQDNSDVVDQLKQMSEKLDEINVGTRMKPQFPSTLKVTNPDGSHVATTNPAPPSIIVAFRTTVTTAGTRVQLASNTLAIGAILEAPSTNTGLVYIGGADVSSTVYGAELQPGQSTSVAVSNTNLIYIDASVSGNKLASLGS